MNWNSCILAGTLLFTSCAESVTHTDGTTTVRIRGPVDWVERGLGDRLPRLSVTAELDLSGGDPSAPVPVGVICRTQQSQLSTHYMIYERRAEEESWGIYGLGGAKNDVSMPLPFDPNSIRYEDRTVRETLAQFLTERGATNEEAEDFLDRASTRLFGEGLRVILALNKDRAPDVIDQFLQGSEDPFLLSIELEQLEY